MADQRRLAHKNRVGQRIGMLTILEYRIKKRDHGKSSAIFFVRCDCGVEKTVYAANVVKKETVSCGCLAKSRHMPPGVAAQKHFYGTYERNAKGRNLIFNISIEQFNELTSKNCLYCNREPRLYLHNRKTYNGLSPTNGIDRIDNKVGYEFDNLVPCCELCNRMKMALGVDDFFQHIKEIYEHSKLSCYNKDDVEKKLKLC